MNKHAPGVDVQVNVTNRLQKKSDILKVEQLYQQAIGVDVHVNFSHRLQ